MKTKNIKLRPHHLLCTQGYSGKGYSDNFVENMTTITKRLQSNENVIIDIVFSTDDICKYCPKMVGVDLCEDNDKVKRFDKKVIDYFGIKEKSYIYKEIIKIINSQMTISMMNDICFECSWYAISACKKTIIK